MDFAATVEALLALEGRLVAMDTTITNPARRVKPEDRQFSQGGVLQLVERSRPDSRRPIDEAAWWVRRTEGFVLRIEPDGGAWLNREHFRGAHWEDEILVVEMASITYRLAPLVRVDGEPVRLPAEQTEPDDRLIERKRIRETVHAH